MDFWRLLRVHLKSRTKDLSVQKSALMCLPLSKFCHDVFASFVDSFGFMVAASYKDLPSATMVTS